MNMPEIAVPTFFVTIPSLKKKIIMRSLTTREFKLFLIAKQGNEEEQITHTIHQLLSACIQDDVDINSLQMYDVEYLFIQLYVNSTAESVKKITYKCKNKLEDGSECGQANNVVFQISDAEVDFSNCSLSNEYISRLKDKSNNDLLLKFIQPNLSTFNLSIDTDLSIIANCLESVTSGEQMWVKGKDFNLDTAKSYISNINSLELENIIKFFYETPELVIKEQFQCPKCKYKHNIELRGLQDFF